MKRRLDSIGGVLALGIGLGIVFLGAPRAAADEAPLHASLVYRAPSRCPTSSDLEARMQALSPRIRFDSDDPSRGPRWRLDVEVSDDATHGTLTVRSDGATVGMRDVSAPTCEEVIDVLAFAAALALDPSVGQAPASSASPQADPSSPPASSPPSPQKPPRERPKVAVAPRAERSFSSSRVPLAWQVAAGASLSSGVSPNPTTGGELAVGVSPTFGALRPLVSLAADVGGSASVGVTSTGTVGFFRAIGVLEGCPHRWSVGRFDFRACVRFEAGERATSGANLEGAVTVHRLWMAAGASAHAQMTVYRPLFLDLEGLGVVPLVRDSVVVKGIAPPIQSPAVIGFGGTLSLGVEFR